MQEKAILLVDNARSHGEDISNGQFVAKFLPPNTTSLIQPMDQNAIRLTKLFYRKSLLAEILTSNEENLTQSLKDLNLKMAVCLLQKSWEKVTSSTLQKCWRNILKPDNHFEEEDPEDLIPLNIIRNNVLSAAEEIEEVSAMLKNIENFELNASEVIDWLDGDAKETETEEDE